MTRLPITFPSGLESALLNIKLRDALRELGDAQRRLIENEKLRSLGEMTANIAHEIKNPLVVIGGFTKRLAKTARLDENESRYVEIITKEVARLEAILTEILNYVKETPLLFELCDINNLLDEILYLLSSDKSWVGNQDREAVRPGSAPRPLRRAADQAGLHQHADEFLRGHARARAPSQ